MMHVFFHGAFLAFSLILPLGPQNVFILSQGVTQHSYKNTLPAVITAALCDTLLIIGAVFGLSLLFLKIRWLEKTMLGVGALFLSYYAISCWKASEQLVKNIQVTQVSFSKQIGFTLVVSLLNPYAMLDTVGVIGANSLAYQEQIKRFIFTLGSVSISWIWFFSLAKLGQHIKKSTFLSRAQHKISALIMFSCFLYLLYRLFN